MVEGEASHALNTSEVRVWMVAVLCFQTQRMDSGVAHMLYTCKGMYRVTPPHPPVRPASLIRPVSLVHPASLMCPVSLACPASRALLHP